MTTVLKINDEPFLSTPSARRATMEQIRRRINNGISIHALREEGDPQLRQGQLCRKEFLSTPSARRATLPGGDQIWPGEISIHALREEGDDYFAPSSGLQGHFYPRPPRGGRQKKSTNTKAKRQFLSTPSARRATCTPAYISLFCSYFYPRPPRGGRLCIPCAC